MKVLGIDQSYTNFGIAIVEIKGEKIEVINVKSFNYKGKKSKTEKRLFIAKLIKNAVKKYNPDYILVERIRQFSQNFISMRYIKATASLIGTIIDSCYPKPVYSVDTRSWKSRVCGSSKGVKRADKGVSVRFVKRRFGLELNDDEADALCIACYPSTGDINQMIKSKLLRQEE